MLQLVAQSESIRLFSILQQAKNQGSRANTLPVSLSVGIMDMAARLRGLPAVAAIFSGPWSFGREAQDACVVC